MSPISRGFRGRRPQVDSARLPPGQHVVDDFPVLSAGSTPHRPLDEWTFQISGAVDQPVSWTWDELLALPAETPTVDIHCVTAWSKLDTHRRGVSAGMLPEGLTPGDLAAVRHRRAVLGGDANPRGLVEWLAERAEANGAGSRVIGFRGHRTEKAVVAGEERGAARMRPA